MGMSGSQARLLALTSRLSDVELRAQQLQSEKLALATQKDELYQKYCDALDATTINVAYRNNGSTRMVQATYKTVCEYNPDRCCQYAIKNNKSGLVIVPENVKQNYEEYSNDKYVFAMAMLGLEGYNQNDSYFTSTRDSGLAIGYFSNSQNSYSGLDYASNDGSALHMTGAEYEVYKKAVNSGDTELLNLYNKIQEGTSRKEKQEILETFRDKLYAKYSAEIVEEMNKNSSTNENWADISSEFEYYLKLWDIINSSGGCETIDGQYQSGKEGKDWFNNMANAAQISIFQFDTTKKVWEETSPATSINNNFLQKTQDETDLKKAEAEYEHGLDIINREDTKKDTDLSKLETERSAIKTQMDALKTVINDNIDRNLKIFS
jgi:hypothetical protein